jgi:hypothetical protein
MASYQPQHQQTGRRADVRYSADSLASSWIVTELARASNENIFSDTLSSPLSDSKHSALPESEQWAEQVFLLKTSCLIAAPWSSDVYDPIPDT